MGGDKSIFIRSFEISISGGVTEKTYFLTMRDCLTLFYLPQYLLINTVKMIRSTIKTTAAQRHGIDAPTRIEIREESDSVLGILDEKSSFFYSL